MEQVRMLLAIALSFLVFFLWNVFFVEKETPGPGAPVVEKQLDPLQKDTVAAPGPKTAETEKSADRKVSEITEKATSPAPPPVDREAKTYRVETNLYSVTISEKRAAFTSVVLKNYRESIGEDSPLKEMISEKNDLGTYIINFEGNEIPGLSDAVFSCEGMPGGNKITDKPGQLVFTWRAANGTEVQKQYTFYPDSYVIDFEVGVQNQAEYPLQNDLTVSLYKHMQDENAGRYGFTGPSGLIDGQLQEVETDDIENELKSIPGQVTWVAVQDRYFMSSLIPKSDNASKMSAVMDAERVVEAKYATPIKPIHPGTKKRFSFEIFMGPKSIDVLQEANYDLEKALSFGWFDFISKPCLKLMNFLYSLIPNYGIDIILLTILIKILFWPLGNKSYKSMNEMKRLQPLMTDIREKYKDDKKRMNEEVMKLYKTYKINPLGGCLPMVAQIPVFIAFYQMLYGAIELRHAPFFGWIRDLSAPDRLFDFGSLGVSIPLMEPPYGIPVLTIIMGATMFIQQKLQPPAGDPTQAKMMMMMPIVFTVIFINFSSGLVLYWLVNNILSIAQQYYVYKKN